MSDLMVKPVDVLGDTIMAAKDEENVIWVGINYFCQGLDMEKKQRDYQVEKVKSDKTLKRGCRKFPAGVFDIANEVYALRLDFIPMWLAKITITKKMEQDHPELADKLLEYQLKAKDILAEAFLPKKGVPQTIPEQIQLLAKGNVEVNKRVDAVEKEIQKLKDDLPLFPNEAEEISNAVKKKGVEVLGGKQSNAYNNSSLQHKVYTNIYANLKYNFDVSTYKSIKRGQCAEALKIVRNYQPPYFLYEQIKNENAQQRFNI